MSTSPSANLDDLQELEITLKATMTVSKLKLCSLEYESATWLAGWQITFYDSATGAFTPLEFKGLTTGTNY